MSFDPNAFTTAFDVNTSIDPVPAPTGRTCVPFEPDYGCCDEWANLTPELQVRAETLAWDTIRVLSGGRLGNCPVTMRPCLGPPCTVCNSGGTWIMPFIRDGQWFNQVCGVDPCSCERLCEIVTPGQIAMLTSVQADGVELPLDQFRVDNGNRIVRMDGECWPSCQHLELPLGEPGTVGVSYVPGIVPSAAGLWAVGVLACEFSKACTGSKCRLPTSVTSVSRQGISYQMSTAMFPNGMTGIREVDAYLVAINPMGLGVPSMVWSPDAPWVRHRYQTWTSP